MRPDHRTPNETVDRAIATLGELLRWRTGSRPDRAAYTFLVDGEDAEATLTYAALDRQARAVAAALQAAGVAPGERALLLYPPGLEYVAGLFGCFYAGVIAVPAYPPDPSRLSRTLPRIQAIVQDARARVALTTSVIASMAAAVFDLAPELRELGWVATDALADDAETAWRPVATEPDAIALLQYTSGSTGSPRGVMVSHANLLANLALITHGFALGADPVGVIWLPPYHDMGLVGGILQPLYAGLPVVLMSPIAFLQRPLRWLEAISRYRGTASGGPNFAFDLCVRKSTPEQRAALDLSSWELAFCGAEPIREDTLERFAEAFAPAGFRREAFYPCYGLAEGTLIVSGGRGGAAPVARRFSRLALQSGYALDATTAERDAVTLVGCGGVLPGETVRIVDPDSREARPDGREGEIWVAGPSVTRGYWRRPDETAQTFNARLAGARDGSDDGATYLRTGDLGVLLEGQLFVTGRRKDLIIVRGRNYYPQDIERAVEQSHAALRPGCGAAFAVEIDGEERVVVVQELERRFRPDADPPQPSSGGSGPAHERRQLDPEITARSREPDEAARPSVLDVDAIVERARRAVFDAVQLNVYAVVLIKAGSIPKTSSGKVQRHACRAGYLDGSLDVLHARATPGGIAGRSVPPPGAQTSLPPASDPEAVTAWLVPWLARRLRVEPSELDPNQPLARLGLDSLNAVELQNQIESRFGVSLANTTLLDGLTPVELARTLAEAVAAGRSAPPIAARGKDDDATAPLSNGQRALWFLHRLAPESTAYNIARAVRIRAELDVDALRAAFAELFARHAALRATFVENDAQAPVERVAPPPASPLEVRDATGWTDAEFDARLREAAARPFDLASGPVARATLYVRGPREYALLFAVHHIVADFWSLAVLARDLGALYAARRGGAAPPTAVPRDASPAGPTALQYADYARWERETLAGPLGERLWRYWSAQLAGELPGLELPLDHPRPAAQTFRGDMRRFALDAPLAHALRGLAQAHDTTLFTALLTSFFALLQRYTGQTDLIVGSPTAGRSRAGFAEVVGYFVNPVALRADLSGAPSFSDALTRTRRVVLGALAHQAMPFVALVERLQPARDPSRSPIFQVSFSLQQSQLPGFEGLSAFALDEPGARAALGPLPVESLSVGDQAAPFDLTLLVAEGSDGGLGAALQYNTDLFDAATVDAMARHLVALLRAAVAEPHRPLAELPLLDAAERDAVTRAGNATSAEYPRAALVHELFEAQVARKPGDAAVVCGGESLSYLELDERANRLAHHLRALEVRAETRVGVCLERSADLVVALLAVLKAGGAYVPLDPAYPAERLAFMATDAGARVVVTCAETARRVGALGVPLLRLDEAAEAIAERPRTAPSRVSTPENLAYVIYTSGSTGRPKGVMVPHRGVVNYLAWCVPAYAAHRGRGAPMHSSVSFDLTVTSLFAPLVAGRPVAIVREDAGVDALAATLRRDGPFGLVKLTPAHLEMLAAQVPAAEAGRLTHAFVIGGEALRADALAFWRRHAPQTRLINEYGPTETVVGCCVHDATDGGHADGASVPIGRPIANTQLYVLDAWLEPLPTGVPGELYIGGDGVARGYHARPALTAERFVPDPFSTAPGARMYRTGDIARRRPDGTLEFLGRRDDQVKLRGFRIELGEVEAALRRQSAVRAAAVVVRRDGADAAQLVGYVVPAPGDALDPDALRRQLRATLPEHMVPAAIVALDALPLTANGKVDRRALPAPTRPRGATGPAPRGAVERLVAAVYAEVLGLEEVGADDHFFELGGHSLRATQVVSRLRSLLGIEVPLRELFQSPTVAGLAAALAGLAHGERLAATSALVLELAQLSDAEVRAALPGATRSTSPPPTPSTTLAPPPATTRVARPLPALAFDPPRQRLLEARLAQRGLRGGALERAIPRRGTGEPLALSFAQQRLWFLAQLQPDSAAYNVPGAFRLTGRLDPDALGRALCAVLRRHEVLRTTFAIVDAQPLQSIAPVVAVDVPILDLTSLPPAERLAEAHRLAYAEAQRPFDLARGPMLRASLLRLGHADHVLLITMHHIASDGWSLSVLVRETAAYYRAFVEGRELELPALPIQYADFAIWQRRWLVGDVLEQQLAFWKRHLADAPATVPLPTDRPRPALQAHRGAWWTRTIPRELVAALEDLARRHDATLYMGLMASFTTLLYRYSRQDDVVVGMPIANRTSRELEGLIGFFVNTLPVRTRLEGNPTFAELLGRVREATLGAYAHQDVPFERLVDALQVARDLSRNPLFQVELTLQNVPTERFALAGLSFAPLAVDPRMAKFDLSLILTPEDGGLSACWEYDTDLFDEATVAQMHEHYLALVRSCVAAPDRRIDALELLAPAEREALLVRWNDTRAVFPQDDLLHQMFAQQAARTPDAVAIELEGARLTYGELDARSNQLARYLRARGAGPEVFVGVRLERSLDLAVGLLAVLKSGAACVPLDMSSPRERLAAIIEDCRASLVLTQRSRAASVASDGAATVCIDEDWPAIARESAAPVASAARPQNLVYVIYTSGSTGRPKGVAMSHAAVANMVRWTMGRSPTAPTTPRTLQFAALGFDISFQEMFSTWSGGGTVVFIREPVRLDPLLLLEVLARHRVERLFLPFVALQQLVEVAAGRPPPSALREVITAGEQLRATPQLRAFFTAARGCSLENQYGPTEAHVVTAHRLAADPASWPALPPIGTPIANTQVYLLDARLNPVPRGVYGEVFIGGAALARGYLGRPAQTAERFVPDPFSTAPGARMYRTGDLARYLPDGAIEFLGRSDKQLKIRGYRVEPGEIEAVVNQFPGVGNCVVIAREDTPGDRRLVGYVVAQTQPAGGADAASDTAAWHQQLRAFVGERLPDYMVPSAFVRLPALPLTAGGKVDLRALPAPERAAASQDGTAAAGAAPRTETEAQLARIWEQVLDIQGVGVDENFFELGGHSLLATQIVIRVRERFAVDLSMQAIFERPTIEGLAAAVDAAPRIDETARVPPIVRVPRDGPLALSFSQERFWLLYALEPASAYYNTVAALRLVGALDVAALRAAIEEIVRRHEVLRTRYAVTDGRPAQFVMPPRAVAVDVVDVAGPTPEAREAAALERAAEDGRRACDLARGEVFRARLLRVGPQHHVFALTLHHIVSDRWTIGVLVHELAALYTAFARRQPSPLPELPLQYADYAAWQRAWLAGPVLDAHLAFWRRELDGLGTPPELPVDRPRPAAPSLRGARVVRGLAPELARAARVAAEREGVTLFMVLLAAFDALINRWAGHTDVAVGSPVANRPRAELEALVGAFINTVVLRVDVSGNPTFAELLGRVRAVTLAAYAHQDVPLELVLRALPGRAAGAPPFRVLFVMQNAPGGTLSLPGLALQQFELDPGTSKLDLQVSVAETADALEVTLIYDADLFDARTVEALFDRYELLLRSALAAPETRVRALAYETEADLGARRRGEDERAERGRARLHELARKPRGTGSSNR